MGFKSLLRLGYLFMIVQGLLSVAVPEKAIALATTGWRCAFENVDELEPREWYVEATRVLGVGLLAAGLTGLLVTDAEKNERQRAAAEYETTEHGDDEDDGPVTVDVEDK